MPSTTATVAHLATLTGTDAALLADEFDAEPVTRLTEDEPDTKALADLDREAEEFDADGDFFWQRSVMNNG
jgi:hypothetical protein